MENIIALIRRWQQKYACDRTQLCLELRNNTTRTGSRGMGISIWLYVLHYNGNHYYINKTMGTEIYM